MTRLIRGSETAEAICRGLGEDVRELLERGVVPTLAIFRMGENKSDLAYENSAARRCGGLGIKVRHIVLPADTGQEEVLKQIRQLNRDRLVHGVLIMRPLPPQIDDEAVRRLLSPQKDVDGITYESLAGVLTGQEAYFPPCTAQACVEILEHLGVGLRGKKITVVGSSLVIGKPVAMMLSNRSATVCLCHIFTKDVAAECRNADIVIAAAGRPRLIGRAHVREGQILLDVGINVDESGAVCGDVDRAAVEGIVAALTPVPGGVGAVTASVLAKHVVASAIREAEKNRFKKSPPSAAVKVAAKCCHQMRRDGKTGISTLHLSANKL